MRPDRLPGGADTLADGADIPPGEADAIGAARSGGRDAADDGDDDLPILLRLLEEGEDAASLYFSRSDDAEGGGKARSGDACDTHAGAARMDSPFKTEPSGS